MSSSNFSSDENFTVEVGESVTIAMGITRYSTTYYSYFGIYGANNLPLIYVNGTQITSTSIPDISFGKANNYIYGISFGSSFAKPGVYKIVKGWYMYQSGKQAVKKGGTLTFTVPGSSNIRIKTSDGWKDGKAYVKTDTGWKESSGVYVKTDAGWKQNS